jgi:hypothetical protein
LLLSRNSTNLFLSEYLSPPIKLTLAFILYLLTFFGCFLHPLFLMVTLKLNPLSSQNPTCNLSGVSLSIFKYADIFLLKVVIFSGSLLRSQLFFFRGKRTFFALISSALASYLILFRCCSRLDVANLARRPSLKIVPELLGFFISSL